MADDGKGGVDDVVLCGLGKYLQPDCWQGSHAAA